MISASEPQAESTPKRVPIVVNPVVARKARVAHSGFSLVET